MSRTGLYEINVKKTPRKKNRDVSTLNKINISGHFMIIELSLFLGAKHPDKYQNKIRDINELYCFTSEIA